MNKEDCVLLINARRACLFKREKQHFILCFEKQNTHKKTFRNAPGIEKKRKGWGRDTLDKTNEIKSHELHLFLKECAAFLEEKHREKEFQRLVVFAAPKVAGFFKKYTSKGIKETLIKIIPKDLVTQDEKKIELQLKKEDILLLPENN